MTASSVWSFFTQGGGGSDNSNELLATVPAGAVLTAIDVTGQLSTESASAAYAAAQFEPLNLMTGLQWVTHGGTPETIVNVPVGGGNWLTFAQGFRVPSGIFGGVTSTSYTSFVLQGIVEKWRGQLPNASSVDVYWSFGENAALSDTVNYRAFCAYRVTWATYP